MFRRTNSRSMIGRRFERSVHPRGRGEQRDQTALRGVDAGSSPRVRGTGKRLGSTRRRRRFIPAGAGNRSCPRWRPRPSAVHPRGCGEQPTFNLAGDLGGGSSPRVRGTADVHALARRADRFIPAGAGNSRFAGVQRDVDAVHPRGCGEQGRLKFSAKHNAGSSPRVRGTAFRNHTRRRP